MKLRSQFILLLGFMNALLIIVSLQLLEDHKLLFLVIQLFIVLSVLISVRLYKAYTQPLNLLSAGIESIQAKDFNTTLIKVGNEDLDQLINVYNTMIEQLREERVKQQEQNFLLENLIEASSVGIIVLDPDGNIVVLNSSAAQLLGVAPEEVLQKPLRELSGELVKILVRLDVHKSEIITMKGQKSVRLLKSHFVEKGFSRCFMLLEEVTKEIYQTEKNAYEKVIRMMSHEVNNSVGAINSILNSVLNYQHQLHQEDQSDFTNALRVAIERNVKLNQFMSNFADVIRTPEPTKKFCDLHTIIIHVTTLMRGNCDAHNIALHLNLQQTPFLVNIDPQQFEQVLVNLLKNSIEAIGEHGWIEVETTDLEQKTLILRDNGKGIPNGIQAQLFTPFYTTKKNGQGIGLTLTKEILHNHGLLFALETVKEGITEFRIIWE